MLRNMSWVAVGLVILGVGCKGAGSNASSDPSASEATPAAAASSSSTSGQATLGQPVKATGKVIDVKLIADAKGARFDPDTITAQPGDVVKFSIASGVHNVHFLPEKNPGAQGLPPASDMLQLPGQSYELLVGAKPGVYHFQCDPHAALGMVGTLTVQ